MLSLALLLLAAPQAAPAAPAQDEIAVIARRLHDWNGSVKIRNGKSRCVTRRSTGDADIDRIGCAAMEQCLARMMPQVEGVKAKEIDQAERDRRLAALQTGLTACADERHTAMIAELADQRAAQGTE